MAGWHEPPTLDEALLREGLSSGRDGLWLDDSGDVGAAVTGSGAYVGWIDVAWPGPHEPVRRLHDVVHVPGRMASELAGAVAEARRRHGAALRTCRYCGDERTPGYMHTSDTCDGCAERHLGIVH